jgi:hypothetical protein
MVVYVVTSADSVQCTSAFEHSAIKDRRLRE